jgi:N-acetylglucosaminyl-diphospho-decaprenol L-rhamnosyltransferase
MSEVPVLSICIINWNGKGMLRDLLRSIHDTKGDLNIQTIVADNASPDGSPDMVAQKFPWVNLIRNSQNLGAARGYNQGVEASRAPLVLLMNNDTLVRPGALQTLVQFINEHPEVAAVAPKLIGGDGLPQRTGRDLPTLMALLNYIQFIRWTGLFKKAYRRYRHTDFDAEKPAAYEQISASAMVVRRELYLRNQFDAGYPFGIEDVDFCARLRKEGQIYYLPSAEIMHLGRISSRANRGFAYKGFECGWVRYLAKFHGKPTAILYKILVTIDMPFRLILLTTQLLIQRISHRSEKAERTRNIRKAAWEFFSTGMLDFWRS